MRNALKTARVNRLELSNARSNTRGDRKRFSDVNRVGSFRYSLASSVGAIPRGGEQPGVLHLRHRHISLNPAPIGAHNDPITAQRRSRVAKVAVSFARTNREFGGYTSMTRDVPLLGHAGRAA